MEFLQGKFRFSKGRQPVSIVVDEVSEAVGVSTELLTKEIPELSMDHLSAGAFWTSERFGEHPVGIHNSLLSQGWIEVKFPTLSVDGSVENDLTDVNRSHVINTHTGEIYSFQAFDGSDEWLASNLGYISVNS